MDKNFERNINNYHRYCSYGKEAKIALKSIRKLEESYEQTWLRTDEFLGQLIKLCNCKSDNILLKILDTT